MSRKSKYSSDVCDYDKRQTKRAFSSSDESIKKKHKHKSRKSTFQDQAKGTKHVSDDEFNLPGRDELSGDDVDNIRPPHNEREDSYDKRREKRNKRDKKKKERSKSFENAKKEREYKNDRERHSQKKYKENEKEYHEKKRDEDENEKESRKSKVEKKKHSRSDREKTTKRRKEYEDKENEDEETEKYKKNSKKHDVYNKSKKNTNDDNSDDSTYEYDKKSYDRKEYDEPKFKRSKLKTKRKYETDSSNEDLNKSKKNKSKDYFRESNSEEENESNFRTKKNHNHSRSEEEGEIKSENEIKSRKVHKNDRYEKRKSKYTDRNRSKEREEDLYLFEKRDKNDEEQLNGVKKNRQTEKKDKYDEVRKLKYANERRNKREDERRDIRDDEKRDKYDEDRRERFDEEKRNKYDEEKREKYSDKKKGKYDEEKRNTIDEDDEKRSEDQKDKNFNKQKSRRNEDRKKRFDKNDESRYDKERKEERYDRRRRTSRTRSVTKSRSRSLSYDRSRYDENNYRRKRNGREIVMDRYWKEHSEERRPLVKQIYDEDQSVELGERFYGGTPKKLATSPIKEKSEDPTKSSDKLGGNAAQKRTIDLLTSRTGGAYIPPAKLKLMQAEITDKSSAAYQRLAWEALKKSIQGYINKVNTSNIGLICRELLRENIIRGRGLLARSIIQAQIASPTFTAVYASLTAVINSKFADVGKLIVNRLAIQFKRAFRTNNKSLCISSTTFIAHLVNQAVADEILALEILTLLVDNPTNDSIEIAISFLKECGMRLTELTKKCVEAVFEMLRGILHEGKLEPRIQYMIEVMFQIRKDGFKDYEAVPEGLDLIEEENQITHVVNLVDAKDSQDILNVFKVDPDFLQNEEKYKELIKGILGSDSEDEGDDSDDEDEEEDSSDEGEEKTESQAEAIIDKTETNLTTLRRTIYLTIQSSLDFEECAHKLMKMRLTPGQEIEFCHMFLDCCAEMRTYDKFYGLLAGRFCVINNIYRSSFEKIFKDSYESVHRLEGNKLRNVSKFFAHLLFTDSMSWEVLACVKLNEEDTTSSGRIFLKILFQELNEYMGLKKLNERLKDVTLQEAFAGIFPRDNPKDTRFSINFFTASGLGGLTDDLREHLKSKPKATPVVNPDSGSSSSSSSSTSSSTSLSSSSSSCSD